jgi:uncharacterized alpha-E superfamily protein
VASNRKTVVDLLVLDAQNPRAILYHLAELRTHAEQVAAAVGRTDKAEFLHGVLKIHAGLAALAPETLDTGRLQVLHDEIAALSDVLTMEYLT